MQGADLAILMRHRALLFGIVGGFILYAAFKPQYQLVACVLAFISMAGFIALAIAEGGFNESLRKVIAVDVIGLVLLAVAAGLLVLSAADGR